MSATIEVRGVSKAYRQVKALDNVSFTAEPGRIVGLIGPNGAGKTTALRAILGLTPYEGELKVLGLDPYTQRDRLMQDVCFIADVAILQTLGIIVLIVGAVLWILGSMGRPVGGRRHYW